jgi:hypothetical protein
MSYKKREKRCCVTSTKSWCMMSEEAELLREMRDLLRLIAEPALAKRDENRRGALREVVGKGKTNARAVLLMDGTRTRQAIRQQSGIDPGNLSRLEKALRNKELLSDDDRPKLIIAIPADFFEIIEK